MTISVLTPTCGRPAGLRLAERWMARQTRQPDEWIVADGGMSPSAVTMGQRVIRRPSPPGPANFCGNLLAGIAAVTGDIVVLWEDDDYYAPTHLEQIVRQLEASPTAAAAGDDQQRYYNLHYRRWRLFQNRGASLCQTAFRADWIPLFTRIVREQLRVGRYGVDGGFWAALPRECWALERTGTVVGIKGLPGQVGLGVGHRPQAATWAPDPKGDTLRAWIGADADVYLREGAAC